MASSWAITATWGFLLTEALVRGLGHSQGVGRKGCRMKAVFSLCENCECRGMEGMFLRQIKKKNPILCLNPNNTNLIYGFVVILLSAYYLLGTMLSIYSTILSSRENY